MAVVGGRGEKSSKKCFAPNESKNQDVFLYFFLLTLLEAASGMHPEWQGGAFKAPPPIKTSFLHNFYGGQI